MLTLSGSMQQLLLGRKAVYGPFATWCTSHRSGGHNFTLLFRSGGWLGQSFVGDVTFSAQWRSDTYEREATKSSAGFSLRALHVLELVTTSAIA
mmetsp:Transcript_64522/g.209454  ORF Transcript_64522/g.209454 Transcript_64522/m.209454 type:complete len:94 (+) Transcript_64522:57-338(+)